MKSQLRPFGDLLALVGAFVLWSLAFILLYGTHGVACAGGGADRATGGALRLGLILLWLGLSMLSGAYAVWIWRGQRLRSDPTPFLRQATLAVAVVGAVSTTWLGLPLFLVRACG